MNKDVRANTIEILQDLYGDNPQVLVWSHRGVPVRDTQCTHVVSIGEVEIERVEHSRTFTGSLANNRTERSATIDVHFHAQNDLLPHEGILEDEVDELITLLEDAFTLEENATLRFPDGFTVTTPFYVVKTRSMFADGEKRATYHMMATITGTFYSTVKRS